MMGATRTVCTLASLMVAGLLLAACDPEEQGRVLHYEKGTYLGQTDEPISEETRRDLRDRARHQAGL